MLGSFLRSIKPFKGKQRLSRILLRKAIKHTGNIEIDGKFGCVYKIPNIKEVIGFELYINGIFEEENIDIILRKLPHNGIFVDMGANIGAIAVPVCVLRPDIKAICIEASERMAGYLAWNVEKNTIRNLQIEKKAISDSNGEWVDFNSPEEQYGKGSISSHHSGNNESVQTINLPALMEKHNIGHIDFIKADVEGYEYFAFKGGEAILREHNAPDILFEFIDSIEISAQGLKAGDAQRLLKNYGYELYRIYKGKFIKIDDVITKGYTMIYATKKKA